MAISQISSAVPVRLSSGEIHVALMALHRAAAMGLDSGMETDGLELRVTRLLDKLDMLRIGSVYVAQLRRDFDEVSNEDTSKFDTNRIREALQGIYEALGENPAPQREATTLLAYFGDVQLAELVGVSTSSIARYARGERRAPAPVVDRLHWLALVVGYLSGTYNEYGVRRWFERSRKALGGHSPAEVLLADEEWSSESEGAQRVQDLARASLGMIAT